MDPIQYLSDQEKAQIEKFVGNRMQFEAVRKVLLAGIYFNGVLVPGEAHDPSMNFALTQVFTALINGHPVSDADIGENIRAQAAGIRLVETGFKKLSEIETKKEEGGKGKGKGNPAL